MNGKIIGVITLLLFCVARAAVGLQSQAAPQPQQQVQQQNVSDVQKKINEANAQTVILNKIQCSKDAVALVGAGTSFTEKDALLALVGGLIKGQAGLNGSELKSLRELCDLISKNKMILSDAQRMVMDQWIKNLDIAVKIATGNDTLMVSLKKLLTTASESDWQASNYEPLVQGVIFAGTILVSHPVKEETDQSNKQSLIAAVRQAAYAIMAGRAKINKLDLSAFSTFIASAKLNALLKDVINPSWESTLLIDIAFDPTAKNNTLDSISNYQSIIGSFTKTTDPYEKGLYISALTTIFSNRKDRSIKELQAFKTLLDMFLKTSNIKEIFDQTVITQVTQWQTILDGSLILLNAHDDLDLKGKIALYQGCLPKITGNNTDYEKNIFVGILSNLFNIRGDFLASDLGVLKDFFANVQKIQGLLGAQQLSVMSIWLKELIDAGALTTQVGQGKTYVDALITKARQTKNLDLLAKALSLMTPATSQTTKNAFVSTLNIMVTAQSNANIDKNALVNLLQTVSKKRIGEVPFLTPDQAVVLNAWINALS